MAKKFEDIAKQQFVKAIQNALPKPTPLIGGKWFRYHPDGKPAHLEFTGIRKLAKATSIPIDRVAKQIFAKLSAEALKSELELTEDYMILVRRNDHQAAGDDKSQAPAEGARE